MVLGNKSDLPGARGIPQLVDALGLRDIAGLEVGASASAVNRDERGRRANWLASTRGSGDGARRASGLRTLLALRVRGKCACPSLHHAQLRLRRGRTRVDPLVGPRAPSLPPPPTDP